MQYEPLSQTDISNLALLEVGQPPIDDIDDLAAGQPAADCRAAFWPSVTEVGRSHRWGCLRLRKNLTQLSFPGEGSNYGSFGTAIGWPGCYPSVPPPYWLPNTLYSGGQLVTWGQAIYYFLGPSGPQLSSNNFINDVTAGLWAQIYSSFFANTRGPAGGLYEWKFGYALPIDYLLMDELNGIGWMDSRARNGSLWEIFTNQVTNGDQTVSSVRALFCNDPWANVKYTALIQDPTIWDPLFIDCVKVLLASKIATQILGDDGVAATKLLQKYTTVSLPNAKLMDAGEGKPHRYDPTADSNFLRSRYGSTAG